MAGLVVVAAPTVYPITVPEARDHCEYPYSDKDAWFDRAIRSATLYVESITWRQLITSKFNLVLDRFPWGREPIYFPRPPLIDVEKVDYLDQDGVSQEWPAAEYRVETSSEPGRLTPEYDYCYPDTRRVTGAVTITFNAGYGGTAADIPMPFRDALFLLVADRFANREATTDRPSQVTANGVHNLLTPYRAKSDDSERSLSL